MVNCLSCFIFVIEMVTNTVTKVEKKTEKRRINLTFLGMKARALCELRKGDVFLTLDSKLYIVRYQEVDNKTMVVRYANRDYYELLNSHTLGYLIEM